MLRPGWSRLAATLSIQRRGRESFRTRLGEAKGRSGDGMSARPMTTRRGFAGLLGTAILSRAAFAHQSRKLPVVGVLWHAANANEERPFREPLMAGFADLG